jgi:hypothetical protein
MSCISFLTFFSLCEIAVATLTYGKLTTGELTTRKLRTGELKIGELTVEKLRTGELKTEELRAGELTTEELTIHEGSSQLESWLYRGAHNWWAHIWELTIRKPSSHNQELTPAELTTGELTTWIYCKFKNDNLHWRPSW